MTAPRSDNKSFAASAGEAWELVVAYFKQETIEPIKGLGRFVAFGVAGAFALGVGLVMLALAGLRLLQEELTAFDGNWSFAPYVIVLVAAGVVTLLAVSRIGAAKRKQG